MITRVIFTAKASKQMRRTPHYITEKLLNWAKEVENFGIQAIRKHKSYHDEPLRGKRLGERSFRLSKQWRAIYCEKKDDSILVFVLEVSPHEY